MSEFSELKAQEDYDDMVFLQNKVAHLEAQLAAHKEVAAKIDEIPDGRWMSGRALKVWVDALLKEGEQ